ncbi:MAG: GIY-YIG nuclease family protein [Acidobacteriota bacterium]
MSEGSQRGGRYAVQAIVESIPRSEISCTEVQSRLVKELHVYIMSNQSRTIYVGVTSDLLRRCGEHVAGQGSVFTHRHHLDRLVYFEQWFDPNQAIAREKELKGWRRSKKLRLIEMANPDWMDLTDQL